MSDQFGSQHPDNPKGGEQREIRYVPVEYLSHKVEDDTDLGLKRLAWIIWKERRYIFYAVGVFALLGLFVALGSGDEYTSEVKLIPEDRTVGTLGGIGGLAHQFGINTGTRQIEGISPDLYPEITSSVVLMRQLLDYELTMSETGQKVTLFDYFRDHHQPSMVSIAKKYTVLLPFMIIGGIKGTFRESSDSQLHLIDQQILDEEKMSRIFLMSREEWEVVRLLRERISVRLNRDIGTVDLEIKMPDPLIAADVADQVVQFLKDYIIDHRTEKARQDLDFVEMRYIEAKERFEAAQERLAAFRDENRGQLTAAARSHMAQTQEQRLQSEYDLTFNLYNNMAERLEEARIKVQDETPAVNVIAPATIPDQRSEPNRTNIMILYLFLGFIFGIVLIMGKQFWLNLDLGSFKKYEG